MFINLHNHSEYSLLDGLSKPIDMAKKAKALGQTAIALTDHGNMFGTIEFYKACKKENIKPICGVETYVAPETIDKSQNKKYGRRMHHLVLLAKNYKGYQNLCNIVSHAYIDGFYYKPRIDFDLLSKYGDDIIVSSACIAGQIPKLLLEGKKDEADEITKKYKDRFGSDFYIELMNHEIPEELEIIPQLVNLAKKYNIKTIATNDSHYVNRDNSYAHDVLLCIQQLRRIDDKKRIKFNNDSYYLKSEAEMLQKFKGLEQSVYNTEEIANKCNIEFNFNERHLPKFTIDGVKTEADRLEYMKQLIRNGLRNRYGNNVSQEVMDRVKFELKVIRDMNFIDYFLVVQDFVNYAKDKGIAVGIGRGSSLGCITSYLLNITGADPIKYNLYFERFLNPGRKSMPDIDIDFEDKRRIEVIDYVTERYGKDCVSQIGTFGRLESKAAFRDVARAFNVPAKEINLQSKKIPSGLTLSKAYSDNPSFKTLIDTSPQYNKIFSVAKSIEHAVRNFSTHACGVLITDKSLWNYVPLAVDKNKKIVCMYEKNTVEELGLLKMDFLGLKNLTTISNCEKLINKNKKNKINFSSIGLNNEKTYELYRKGDTKGVFQVESPGMQKWLKELKPDNIEDIVSMVAIYRPGPMKHIKEFIDNKRNPQNIHLLHKDLKPILKDTNFVCIYQESVMAIAKKFAGFTLAEADDLRKAMGHKIAELMKQQKTKFISGSIKNGYKEEMAIELFELLESFSSYGFNRCLSGDAEIIDAKTYEKRTIEEIYKTGKLPFLFTLNDNLKLESKQATAINYNGIKQIYKITTKSGRTINCTNNHKFFTYNGWKELKQLEEMEYIAIPRIIPENKNPKNLKNHEIITIGYLLAKGNLCHPSSIYFYSNNIKEIKDYNKNAEMFTNTEMKFKNKKNKKNIESHSKRINKKEKQGLYEFIRNKNLLYKKATEKFIPNEIFQMDNDKIALFLSKMFQGDGCLFIRNKNKAEIFYSTSSEKMAKQFSELLLRLNIFNIIHTKKFKYKNTIKIGYTINVSGFINIKNFCLQIGQHFISTKKEQLNKIIDIYKFNNVDVKANEATGTKDIIPISILPEIKTEIQKNKKYLSLKEFAKKGNISYRLLLPDKKKIGFRRKTISKIGNTLNSQRIKNLGNSDIYWDTIKNIEYIGREKTYDLTVPETHNFVANNIIVHNSHAVGYGLLSYQTAYLKANYPTEFMCALLNTYSHDENKIEVYSRDCSNFNVSIDSININNSFREFTINNNKRIQYGFSAVKGLVTKDVDRIVEERTKRGNFISTFDFMARCGSLNKRTKEQLSKAGAFDEFENNRSRVLTITKNKKLQGISLFVEEEEVEIVKSDKQQFNFSFEKDAYGFYLSDHPISYFNEAFHYSNITNISDLGEIDRNAYVKIFCIIDKVEVNKHTNKGKIIHISDLSGSSTVFAFSNYAQEIEEILGGNYEEQSIAFILTIRIKIDGEYKNTTVQSIDGFHLFSEALEQTNRKSNLYIKVKADDVDDKDVTKIVRLLRKNKGEDKVFLQIEYKNIELHTGESEFKIKKNIKFSQELKKIIGKQNIVWKQVSKK